MLQLPTIPSDNLYKFILFSGILMILAYFILSTTRGEALSEKITKVEMELAEMELKSEFTSEDSKRSNQSFQDLKKTLEPIISEASKLKKEPALIKNRYSKFRDKTEREYYEFIYKHDKEIFPELEQLNEQMEKDRIIKERFRESKVQTALLKIKNNELRQLHKKNSILNSLLETLMDLGFVLSGVGIVLWYVQVQRPTDRKLKLELLKLQQEMKTKVIESQTE